MHKTVALFSLLLTVFLLMACSGSKSESEQAVYKIEDVQTQAKAKDLIEKIEDNPGNLLYRRQLAELYQGNGNLIDAMKTLEQALVIDPNDAETKYFYAGVAMHAGDKMKAYQAYKEVLQGSDGNVYLDRIAPLFTDAFLVEPVVSGAAQEAFGNYSADGTRIVYQSDQNGNWDIFEYNISTQNTVQITNTPDHEENPDYSPIDNNIIYTSTEDDHRDVEYNQKLRDIYVHDLTTGKKTNLTTNGSNDWRPRYSTDGAFIAFVSERNDLRSVPFYQLYGDIFIMENDGRFQLSLTHSEANSGSPCIAPGSTEQNGAVYFDSNVSGSYAIYKVNFKGEERKQITFNPNSNDLAPAVSWDGGKIVFFSDRDGNYELYMMNTDGSGQQRLTSNPSEDLNPVFSPDGRKVLFHSDRSGNYDLYMLDLTSQSNDLPLYKVIDRIDEAMANAR